MAYCNECGAYIPDGQSKCLACGYDPEEEKAKAEASAAAKAASAQSSGRYTMNNDELRERLKEQRRQQREQSRVWAEKERERRMEQEERAKQQFDNSKNNENAEYGNVRNNNQDSRVISDVSGDSKLFAILSYISVLSLIPFFFRRNDEYAMYHARQGLVLLIYSAAADLLSNIPFIGWIFTVFRIICMVKGIINASSGIEEELPYIGKYGQLFR